MCNPFSFVKEELNHARYEDNTIRIMGSYNVDLSLGDVLSIFAGDFEAGKFLGDMKPTQATWMAIAAIMLVPIIMVVLYLTLKYPAIRWVNIIVAIIVVIFNLFGLPGYPGAYEKFLIIVSFVFNSMTIWYAWKWTV